jgi:hypothetical protein
VVVVVIVVVVVDSMVDILCCHICATINKTILSPDVVQINNFLLVNF